MASDKVIQSLETLHRELDKLSPAIEHVKTAQRISETVKDIPNKHLELLKSVKESDENFKKQLKEQLKSEADKVSSEVKQIIQNLKETQNHTSQNISEIAENIENKQIDLIKTVKETDESFKKELKEQLKTEADKVTSEVNQIIQKLNDTLTALNSEIIDLEKLKKTINDFHLEITRINFPQRLEKIDANISGIMAAVQAVQSRIDSLERNITDRLKENSDFQKEMKTSLQNSLDQTAKDIKTSLEHNTATSEAIAKKQQTNMYITWALFVLSTILIVIFIKI